tara:strand:- start:824 stop:1594 length:771 start_codon:yes stop_codon:yes gene_type:complete
MNLKWTKDFFGAWIFYTALPLFPKAKPTFHRIARFAPIIGLIIGLIQTTIWFILENFGFRQLSITCICLCIGFLITGGIHLDGLMDTFDGLAAKKDNCNLAMKDSRVGAYGVQSLMIIILLQIASLFELSNYGAISFPIIGFWGRFSSLWAIEKFPYLHLDNSKSFHHENWKGMKEMIPSIIILIAWLVIIISIPLSQLTKNIILIGFTFGILPAILIPNILGKRLGGHSGDSYGACVVLVETSILAILSISGLGW